MRFSGLGASILFPPLLLLSIGLTLALCWIVPFNLVWHTYPVSTFYAECAAFILFMLLAAQLLAASLRQDARLLQVPRAVAMPVGFALVLALQLAILPLTQPLFNIVGLIYALGMVVTMCAGFWAARMGWREALSRWSAYALIAGALFATFCLVIQAFHLEPRVSWLVARYTSQTGRRLFANMYQANHLATYLAFGCGAAMYLWHLRRIGIVVWALLSFVLCTALALTVSRAPWLQLTLIALAGLWLASRPAPGLPRREGIVTRWAPPWLLLPLFYGATQLVLHANVWLDLQLGGSALNRFEQTGQLLPRLAMWRYAWAIFEKFPWLGAGWGEFIHQQYLLADRLGTVEMANNAHNVVLDLLAKTGVAGLLLVAVPLLAWLWRVLRGPQHAPAIFAMMLLGVLGIHAMVEYPQQYAFFLLPAMFLIGLAETRAMPKIGPGVVTAFHLGALASGVALLIYVVQDYQRTEVAYRAGQLERYRHHPATFLAEYGDYALTSLLPLNKDRLAAKIAQHEQALTLGASNTLIRRYIVLLALAGRDEQALVNVARLKSFSGDEFAEQYALLLDMCTAQGSALADFRARLFDKYGPPDTGAVAAAQ